MVIRLRCLTAFCVIFLTMYVVYMLIWDVRHQLSAKDIVPSTDDFTPVFAKHHDVHHKRHRQKPTHPTTTSTTTRTTPRTTTTVAPTTRVATTTTKKPSPPDPFECLQNINFSLPTAEEINNVEIRPGKTIFLMETSCRSRTAGRITLNGRQGCAVESAAKAHPNLDVVLLVLSPAPIGQPANPVITALTDNYNNIRVVHADINKYFKNTPVDELYHSGRLGKSNWPMEHLSDVLRFITLWKYGGIYLDLDVVITRNLEDIGPNFTGFESPISIAAGVLGFDFQREGHLWVQRILEDVNKTFSPHVWAYNALGVLRKQLTLICNTKNITEMTPQKCQGFNVLPKPAFYPIAYPAWSYFFNAYYTASVMRDMARNETRAAHMWNKLSFKRIPDEGSAYRLLAEQFCPNVYSVTKYNF